MTNNTKNEVTIYQQHLDAGLTQEELAPFEWLKDASAIRESVVDFAGKPKSEVLRNLRYKITSHRLTMDGVFKDNSVIIDHQFKEYHTKQSRNYRLVPHGFCLDKSVEVASKMGIPLQPINLSKTKRFGRSYVQTDNGTIMSRKGNLMVASILPEKLEEFGSSIESNGFGKFRSGITIMNSYGGQTALFVIPFTYQLVCENQMHHLVTSMRAWNVDTESKLAIEVRKLSELAWSSSDTLQKMFPKATTFTDLLHSGRITHHKQLDEEFLGNLIRVQLMFATSMLDKYPQLEQAELTAEFAEDYLNNSELPQWFTKAVIERPTCGLSAKWDKEEKEWTEIKIQGNATKMHLLDATTYTGSNSFRSNSMYGHIRSLYPAIHKRFFVGEESKQVLVSKD